jgi:hypothetical protein
MFWLKKGVFLLVNVTLWEQKSNKSTQVKEMQAIIDFYA